MLFFSKEHTVAIQSVFRLKRKKTNSFLTQKVLYLKSDARSEISFSQLHCTCPATSLLIEHIPPCSCSSLHVAQKEYSQGLAWLHRALLDSLIRGRLRDIFLASSMHSHANSHLSYLNKWSLSCTNP